MKQKLTLLFFICILSALNINAEVYEGSCGTNVRYSLDTNTGLLSITGTGAMNNYNYYSSVPWYSNKEYVKTVEISNGVTSIGDYAFYKCSGLTSVTIPNSVTSIGKDAFCICSGLTSITIPNSVTSIGDYAFEYCRGLTSVTIGNSVTYIGIYAFRGCSGLTSVTIPNSVTSIGEGTFRECSGLTSVTIGNSVTSIGSSAFCECSSLTSVTIGNSVTSIGEAAFVGCSGLTSIEIPNNVTSIGNYAFYGCSKLADVYCYAENVPSTQSDAFKDSYVNYATLYVPEGSVAAYKAKEPWSGFGTIKTLSGEIPVSPKCATPTISYVDGKLTFDCETEGVEYVSSITPPSAFNSGSKTVSMPTTYKVTVYATKDGYENSDVATKDINVSGGASGLRGDVNNDGTVNMPDAMFIVNKILNGKFPDE